MKRIFYAHSISRNRMLWYGYFVVIIFIQYISSFLKKIENNFIVNSTDEIALVLCLPLILKGIIYLWRKRYGRLFILFYSSYLFVGMLSGFLHRVPAKQMVYQGLLELKIPLMVLAVFGIPTDKLISMLQRFLGFSKLLIAVSVPLIILQFLYPNAYYTFFPNAGDTGVFFLPNGSVLPRASGVFWFTGELAFFSGLLLIAFLIRFYLWENIVDFVWVVIVSLVLLCTFSRGEIVGTLLGILIVFSIVMSRKAKVTATFLMVPIIPLLYIAFSSFFQQLVEEQQLTDIEHSSAARALLYYYGFVLAEHFFPLGSGLGTFGGQASVVFQSDLYYDLGFDKFWWFHLDSPPLTDTFWPHIYGEAGYLGLLFIVFSLLALGRVMPKLHKLAFLFRRRAMPKYILFYTCVGWGGFVLLLINSFSSPNFYQPIYMFPLLMFMACSSKLFSRCLAVGRI